MLEQHVGWDEAQTSNKSKPRAGMMQGLYKNKVFTMNNKTKLPLIGGTIAALLSTVCCILPLLLLTLGVSGAWMSNLTALEPYKPYFIIIASVLLWVAYSKIFLTKRACEDGKPCAVVENNQKYKIIFWIAVGLILGSATISFWAPLFY